MPNKPAENKVQCKFYVDRKLLEDFRKACYEGGFTMTDRVVAFMQAFVRKGQP